MLVGEPDEPVLLLPAGVCHPLETYQMELEDPKNVKKDEDDDGDGSSPPDTEWEVMLLRTSHCCKIRSSSQIGLNWRLDIEMWQCRRKKSWNIFPIH